MSVLCRLTEIKNINKKHPKPNLNRNEQTKPEEHKNIFPTINKEETVIASHAAHHTDDEYSPMQSLLPCCIFYKCVSLLILY